MNYAESVRGVSSVLADASRDTFKVSKEPCYAVAIRVSEMLADQGIDSRILYAGGHGFSQLRVGDRFYLGTAFVSDRRLIRAPRGLRERLVFDASADRLVTVRPSKSLVQSIGKIGYSGLEERSNRQFLHTMSLDEAKTIFGAFEKANGYRAIGNNRAYCQIIADELDGAYVPIYDEVGEGVSKAATSAIRTVYKCDRMLGEATVAAMANTSTYPELTAECLTAMFARNCD
jgi:hypothetical protein